MTPNTVNESEISVSFINTSHIYCDALSSISSEFSFHLTGQRRVELATFKTFMYHLRPILVSLFVLSIPFIFNYIATWLFFQIRHWSKKSAKVPPTIPHLIPFLGSSLDLGLNALNFVKYSTYVPNDCKELSILVYIHELIPHTRWRHGKQAPFRVALMNIDLYFVQGPENIVSLWKKSATMTGTPLHLFCLKYLFGMPSKTLDLYEADDSGLNAQPLPGSHVAPHNRVDYRTHVGLLKFTKGAGLGGFYERWETGFLRRLRSLDIGDEWVEIPDLMTFFSDHFGSALIESICGSLLTHLNPDFSREFSEYDQAMPGLLKGLPRWMNPHAYQVRDKLISSIKQWHAFAREQAQERLIDLNEDADPYWGSAFIRERQGPQGIFASIDGFDEDACAASDLGFIWA